jgi:hypothetical protein
MPPLCPGSERVSSPIYPQMVRGATEQRLYSLLRTVRTVAAQGISAIDLKLSVRPPPFAV